ncbi:hypothetical protein XELAEV_18006396mg [Xenopus laevis]|uniref:Uncharacterized protein n=1 Tax=Xenopus laevis TaxID=8355 RepID=A0A974E131_XENLA|nr:hypothetical protein XELAEV_18006396mg [Xenopus laevis]
MQIRVWFGILKPITHNTMLHSESSEVSWWDNFCSLQHIFYQGNANVTLHCVETSRKLMRKQSLGICLLTYKTKTQSSNFNNFWTVQIRFCTTYNKAAHTAQQSISKYWGVCILSLTSQNSPVTASQPLIS